jgi:hypothetical protein
MWFRENPTSFRNILSPSSGLKVKLHWKPAEAGSKLSPA